jgi:hypothetical protein
MSTRSRRSLVALAMSAAVLAAAEASAWPSVLMESLNRDARRLVPATLARLLADREKEIFEESRAFPAELAQAMAADLSSGNLRMETIAALDARAFEASALLREQRVSDGIVKLGALLRIPADLADPVLSAGPEGYPLGVTREYYTFISGSLDKIPVVVDNEPALRMPRRGLGGYWQTVLGRSRIDSPVIRLELFRNGRVVSHRTIDYRSPVFGVASLSYSRAVTAIAATWLAVWRDVRGDVTRTPRPATVEPSDAPPVSPTPILSPGATPPPSVPGARGAGFISAQRAGRVLREGRDGASLPTQ